MSFRTTISAAGGKDGSAATFKMMAAAKRLETWDAKEMAAEASVSLPTARAFGERHDEVLVEKVATSGRPKNQFTLSSTGAKQIDDEVSAVFQQLLRIYGPEARESILPTFKRAFPNVDFERGVSPSEYDEELLAKVFSALLD